MAGMACGGSSNGKPGRPLSVEFFARFVSNLLILNIYF